MRTETYYTTGSSGVAFEYSSRVLEGFPWLVPVVTCKPCDHTLNPRSSIAPSMDLGQGVSPPLPTKFQVRVQGFALVQPPVPVCPVLGLYLEIF